MSADKPVMIHGGPRVASMEESDRVEVEPVRKSCAVVVSCAVVLCFFLVSLLWPTSLSSESVKPECIYLQVRSDSVSHSR